MGRRRKPNEKDLSLERRQRMSTRGWLTLTGLSEATGVVPEVLRAGVESGKLAGWYQAVGGQLKFKPATIEFVRWSDRLADAVINGDVSVTEAERLLVRRSRRISFGLPR
jgi:hypothetical protein